MSADAEGRSRIAVVLGTRPEAIKLFVLVELLGERALVIHTGQHYDRGLAGGVNDDVGLRRADVQFDVGGLRRGEQIGRATAELTGLFAQRRPGAVVVQGDTNAALAGALAANAEEIPLVHVEAGLRSYDRAMPEEHNRVLIDHLAELCAAPTGVAADQLRAEGIAEERVAVTGNTVVEAVERMAPDDQARRAVRKRFDLGEARFVLATLHRPENVDREAPLRAALVGLAELGELVVVPLHPRTVARVREFGLDDLLAGLRVVPPLPPSDFLALTSEASLLVSDSGGIQEEASVLKKPVLVVRRSTERPEALGTFSELIGPAQIAERGRWHLDGPGAERDLAALASPFGDGTASERIAERTLRLADGVDAAPAPGGSL